MCFLQLVPSISSLVGPVYVFHPLHAPLPLLKHLPQVIQNMTIPIYTICPCQLICCFFQYQHVQQFTVFLLSTNSILHITLTIDLSALLKRANLFSLKHHILLPYNIADLTQFLYTFPFICKESFSEQYLTTLSEFLQSQSCSCSHCSFTSSTGIQPIITIAKSFHSFHFITHHLLLHFSHTICHFMTFTQLK